MLNIKIRGLETMMDKVSFEKSEISQEKDQAEKELRITEEQRKRLEITNRSMQTQLEKVRRSKRSRTVVCPGSGGAGGGEASPGQGRGGVYTAQVGRRSRRR